VLGSVDESGVLSVNGDVLRIRVEEAKELYSGAIPELLAGEL
jgi:hypothetical protein